jgi:hypothetical protein
MHSTGPWHAEHKVVFDWNDKVICRAETRTLFDESEEREAAANARLIAKAPEIIELLEEVRRAIPMAQDLGERIDRVIRS